MSKGTFSHVAAQDKLSVNSVSLVGCVLRLCIRKTYLYNFDPLKPHFYIVKLRFTGVYIIFLISAHKHGCGYS